MLIVAHNRKQNPRVWNSSDNTNVLLLSQSLLSFKEKTINRILQHLELIWYYWYIRLFIASVKQHEASRYINGLAYLFRLSADVDETSITLNPLIRIEAKKRVSRQHRST